mmetsp:Transcript_35536/g.43904  ORF Transcript_35536/g.43904 Transcript_35536/m.43904 type:complete len:306 (-) Transcript_35536:159-1076(-)
MSNNVFDFSRFRALLEIKSNDAEGNGDVEGSGVADDEGNGEGNGEGMSSEGISKQIIIPRDETSKSKLTSPNSITLDYKDDLQNYSIVFGVQGSQVGIAVSKIRDPETGDCTFHFGLILYGNTYKIIDNNDKSKNYKANNYMLFHLLENGIAIYTCNDIDKVAIVLNNVWTVGGEKDFYHKLYGHSVLSVSWIANFINKEKNKKIVQYDYSGMKKDWDKNDWAKKWNKDALKKITNCFLFVIRMVKILNIASKNISKIPDAEAVMAWSGGKDSWKKVKGGNVDAAKADRFIKLWDHSVKYCNYDI